MIIDCHGHVSAPAGLWAYKASVGSKLDPAKPGSSHTMDDIAPIIAGFDFLSGAEKAMILEGNARSLFKLAV